MYRKKSLREIIIESSVIISSLLIFFGFLKQYWYFNNFGIKIQQYLSFDEVLILFFGELPFIIKLIIFSALYFFVLHVIFKIYCSNRDSKLGSSVNTEQELNKSLNDFFNEKKTKKLFFLGSVILNVICFLLFNYFHSEVTIVYLSLISAQTILFGLELLDIGVEGLLRETLIIICCLSLMLYCKNKIDLDNIFNQAKASSFVIILKKEKIITNNDILFIGKTKEYLFLYNNSLKQTRIIKCQDVDEINIQSIIK